MNTEQARAIVKETFPQAFDKGRFRQLAVNLLNHIDESKAQAWNTTYIKDAFKDHVKGYERLGTYTSPDGERLDVLIVHLTAESKLERARTAIRNFVADHLKTRDGKDAALVAFISPTEKQWRFSYVKMEYAAIEKEDGKVGVQTKLTPARRSSYIVGENESCHTAQSRFLDLLQDTENHPTLTQIEDAFSVEAVTKEFFEQYKALFLDLKDELDDLAKKDKTIGSEFAAKNVSTADFAKKLMGQIVFLYFLQKKGWLGVPKGKDWGDGPHNFLRQLFASKFGGYKNFFNDILEPLFYDTLATDRGHEAMCKSFNCRIPFLNGGLFEPVAGYDWQKTNILIPNSLFSNAKATDAGDEGTGILDVFDRYNFTVNEAEPLEKEVAIDPEMLGKVFENLLEVKERKSKGSFYTPREIVHYMCQESLINYLDTAVNSGTETVGTERRKQGLLGDEKAEQTLLTATVRKELIPRADIETFIHSGDQASYYEAARVEGTSYQRKLPKTIETHSRLLDDLLANIAVCDPAIGSGAFPVGMMQEIVRARSALTPYFNDVKERTAYHFKRHAIQNCIYGVDIDPGAVEIAKLRLWLSLVVDEDDVKQIKPLPNLDYKVVCGNSLHGFPFKSQGLLVVEETKKKFFDETDHDRKAEFKAQIDEQIQRLLEASKKSLGYCVKFDFHLYFSEVFHTKKGFDVIIGNPPYLNFKSYSSEDREVYKQLYREIFDGKADLLYYFIFKGMALANPSGVLSFITSRYWLEAEFAAKLRQYISRNYGIREILDFGNAVIFEQGIKVAISTIVKKRDFDHTLKFLSYIGKKFEGLQSSKLEVSMVKESSLLSADNRWIFVNSNSGDLLTKISANSVPLDDIALCKQGIVTGRDRAFIFEEKTPIKELPKSLIKPWIKVGDVHRYSIVPVKTRSLVYTNDIDKITDYPSFHEGLKTHSARLKTRREVGNGKIRWFDLQWPREKRFFESEKLVCRFKASQNTFALDSNGLYCSADITIVIIKDEFRTKFDIKYLLALLNSSVMDYQFKSYAKMMDYRYEYYPKPVSMLRVFNADQKTQKPFVGLVDRIFVAKQRDAEADTSALEREIDELVYALYGLTPEEKALVQSAAK